MANRIGDRLPAGPQRLAALFGLATAILSGTLAGPAYADYRPNGWDNGARHAPPDQQRADRDHGRQYHRRYDHGDRYDYYYSAPPVVYAPQGYYQQTGPTLYYSFPLPR